MPIAFFSDNVAGVAPEIMEAMAAANTGSAAPWGQDSITSHLNDHLDDVFEMRVTVFLVATGTAANALALASVIPPYRSLLCHHKAHVYDNENGAVEFFTQGARLVPLAGDNGKIDPAALEAELKGSLRLQSLPPAGLTLTNLTECGTAYTTTEVSNLARTAKDFGLYVHLDGARFANAVASLNCNPAELTWRAGVDILSFGATKNGTMNADAIVVFNKDLVSTLSERFRRSGQRMSKTRFLSAQLEAYLANDLWLRNARCANEMATRLQDGIVRFHGVKPHYTVDGNLLFTTLPNEAINLLRQKGLEIGHRETISDGQPLHRMATSFETSPDEIDRFLQILRPPDT